MINTAVENIVKIRANTVDLEGALGIPDGARGIVLFAHGSGSNRHSPQNNFVARSLRAAGLGTLLIEKSSLLSPVQHTCSRNPVPWRKWPAWQQSGSANISNAT